MSLDKPIRKAVRCFLIEDNKVVVIKYKSGNKREGYYDMPGGKIEDNETSEQTAIREFQEETGLKVKNLKYKGLMIIDCPSIKYIFDTFIINEYEGMPQEFKENTSEWIDIEELLKQEKILPNIIVLDKFFVKGLIDENYNFNMTVIVDNEEKILNLEYSLKEV